MQSFPMETIYYSPIGYWRGNAAISKLANASSVTKEVAKNWLSKQAIWQIYLPRPRQINFAHFDVSVPNEVHQADLFFLPHDVVRRKTYKFALTVVDVANRYKKAELLMTKTASEVASAFKRIYQRGPLNWPQLLQVDPGKEFQDAVSSLMKQHSVAIRRGHTEMHRIRRLLSDLIEH